MKPNQRGRFGGRHNNNNAGARGSRSQMIFRNTSLESTGPCGKLRGTALQLHEKYLAAAKDARIQNDEVLAETCLQYADHYLHIQTQAILNEQALREQQMQNRMPAERPEEVEEPVSEQVPEPMASEEPDEKEDGNLKVMDLSVPVSAMNEQSTVSEQPSARPVLKPRRVLRPRTQKPTESSENTEPTT